MTPHETAAALPYLELSRSIEKLLTDKAVVVPARLVQALPGGASLFVMPAHDATLAITKVITFTPCNAGTDRATIHGDILVFEIATGRRINLLDGPTVTARRTAAVSLLAAQQLCALRTGSKPEGPMLIVGAGVQGHAHLSRDADHEAGDLLQAGLDVSQFPSLREIIISPNEVRNLNNDGPIFFKSCGWAGWDLAAARAVQLLPLSTT